MDHVNRRQFVQGVGVAGLGLLGGCGRLPGQAEPPKVYRIGWLAGENVMPSQVMAFEQGLQELGYSEGRNLILEKRTTPLGRNDQFPQLAAELAALPLDVLVAGGFSAVRAAMNVTQTIPVSVQARLEPGACKAGLNAYAPYMPRVASERLGEAGAGRAATG